MDIFALADFSQKQLAAIAGDLGVRQMRNLIVMRRWVEEVEEEEQLRPAHLVISPKPYIRETLYQQDSAYGVQVREDRYDVYLPKSYPRQQLAGSNLTYFIDAELIGVEIQGGFECEFIDLVDNSPGHWLLNLKKLFNEREE